MQKIILTIAIVIVALQVKLLAQQEESKDYSEWLSIGVFMPLDTVYELQNDQIRRLENKVISLIARNGIAAKISAFRIKSDGSTSPDLMSLMAKGVVCVPKFEIYDTRKVNPGMKKLVVVDVNLTLTVQYIYEDVIFSDITIQLQGSGSQKTQAVNSAIRSINTKSELWEQFLNKTHSEIIRYYDGMCEKLMAQATQLYKLNLTSEALTKLWPIPKEVNCHSLVEELTIEIYEKHINLECKKRLLEARYFLAANQYDDGLEIVGKVDPSSDCFDDALKMIEVIEKEMDENVNANRNANMLLFQQEFELERLRIENMQEMVGKKKSSLFQERILSIENK